MTDAQFDALVALIVALDKRKHRVSIANRTAQAHLAQKANAEAKEAVEIARAVLVTA